MEIQEILRSYLDNATPQAREVLLRDLIADQQKRAADQVLRELGSALVGQLLATEVLPEIDSRINQANATITRLESSQAKEDETRAALIAERQRLVKRLDKLPRSHRDGPQLEGRISQLGAEISASDSRYSTAVTGIARQRETVKHLTEFKNAVADYKPPESTWFNQFLDNIRRNGNGTGKS